MKAEQALTMARYNRWMNERLYEVCAEISDVDRKADRGAFFGSIHGTLNHILLGDKVWLGRFESKAFAVTALDQQLFEDFSELRAERRSMDMRIEVWAGELIDDLLAEDFLFTSVSNPTPKVCPLWLVVTHFFNHQTHHRGQISTLLSQLGIDPGVTDLPEMPGLVSEAPN